MYCVYTYSWKCMKNCISVNINRLRYCKIRFQSPCLLHTVHNFIVTFHLWTWKWILWTYFSWSPTVRATDCCSDTLTQQTTRMKANRKNMVVIILTPLILQRTYCRILSHRRQIFVKVSYYIGHVYLSVISAFYIPLHPANTRKQIVYLLVCQYYL